jgi:hypothetical protein
MNPSLPLRQAEAGAAASLLLIHKGEQRGLALGTAPLPDESGTPPTRGASLPLGRCTRLTLTALFLRGRRSLARAAGVS